MKCCRGMGAPRLREAVILSYLSRMVQPPKYILADTVPYMWVVFGFLLCGVIPVSWGKKFIGQLCHRVHWSSSNTVRRVFRRCFVQILARILLILTKDINGFSHFLQADAKILLWLGHEAVQFCYWQCHKKPTKKITPSSSANPQPIVTGCAASLLHLHMSAVWPVPLELLKVIQNC